MTTKNTTKTKLVWRLGKLPTIEELRDLVKDKILTNDEAREILFAQQTEEEGRDEKSLKDEIKFLRELVDKLSSDRSQVVRIIKEVHRPYENYGWFYPYAVYSGDSNIVLCSSGSGSTTTGYVTASTNCNAVESFAKINNF